MTTESAALSWIAPAAGIYFASINSENVELASSYLFALDVPYGDSNLDGVFNSSDFVAVFKNGEYEDDTPGNSTWEEGDWNGDGDFNTSDFVKAFAAGTYEIAPAIADRLHEARNKRPSAVHNQFEHAIALRLRDELAAIDHFFSPKRVPGTVTRSKPIGVLSTSNRVVSRGTADP